MSHADQWSDSKAFVQRDEDSKLQLGGGPLAKRIDIAWYGSAFIGFDTSMAVNVTNAYRPWENSAARKSLHLAKDIEDGSPMDAGVIVGRDHERRLLTGLVDSLNARGGAVVIFGEPGMGKTSLLRVVADYASRQDVSVHMLRRIESEAVLPFAAITDLLWPLQEHLTTLPAIQREAACCASPGWAGPWAARCLCRHTRSSRRCSRSASAGCLVR